MRLLVIVPSAKHKVTAGSRIRYDRLGAPGEALSVVVQSLDELTSADLDDCHAVVLSKTYSVGAIAIAGEARRRGKVVGVDLFDDYFSTVGDARLTRFRTWLGWFADAFDFALCSTPTMRRTIAAFAPELPVLVVPDSYPEIDPSALASTLAAKRERAMSRRVIDIVWFGIGGNPFFPVGLQDLAAFAWSLDSIAPKPFSRRLTILTDEPAQSARNLSRLRRVTIPHRIETWSLEAEAEALDRALVAFIPVNGQSFSRAKSLNRALTAVSAGAQVLSPGFPLYRDLGEAIYRNGAEIVPDLVDGRLRIRPENVGEVTARAADLSAISAVVSELYQFLVAQTRAMTRRQARDGDWSPQAAHSALILNQDADRDILTVARKVGVLTVRGPLTRVERVFDVRLDSSGGRDLDVWIRPEQVGMLDESLRKRCSAPQAVGKVQMVKVAAGSQSRLDRPLPVDPGEQRSVFYETSTFDAAVSDVERVCARLFPGIMFLSSDIRPYMRPISASSVI